MAAGNTCAVVTNCDHKQDPRKRSLDGIHVRVPHAFCVQATDFLLAATPQSSPVVGSITLPICVILVAGKPLSSACLRMTASSFARYIQNVLSAATNDSDH